MAESFMIRFVPDGKPCYANVYEYDTNPKQYHVHVVNPHLCPDIPPSMVLVRKGQQLSPLENQPIPLNVLNVIAEEILKNVK